MRRIRMRSNAKRATQVKARGGPLRQEQKMALNFNGRRVAETRDYTPEAM